MMHVAGLKMPEASAIANNLSGNMIDYGVFEETDLRRKVNLKGEAYGK